METIGSKSLGIVDWICFASLLVVSLGIGVYIAVTGRGNHSTQEYLLGGRQMPVAPVAISLLGGVISAISILGLATEMYFFGTQLALNLVGFIFGTLVVQYVILPIIYPLKIVSLNEYIVMRFGSNTLRKLATIVSLICSFIYMGMCLYAPSLTLSTVTSLPTWASITVMGVICTFYITLGGVKAVVYTDVVQTILMLGGVLVVVIICCIDLGGVGNIFRLANEGGRLEFFNFDPNPLVRHTFWSVQIQGFFSMLSWVGCNQSCYQRFASVSSLTLSKRLCTIFIVGLYVLWLTFYFSGIVAYATYKDCDPLTSGRIEKPDQILPFLVLDKLSHLTGMAGIFVAAVYGGVLSSLSSTGNSVACILWQDLLSDLKMFKDISDASATKVIKLISATAGVIGIGLGLAAGKLGDIFQVSVSISSTFAGSLVGIFIAGVCAPWMNKKGAYVGLLASLSFNLWLVIGKFMKGLGSPEKLPLSVDGCPENLLHLANTTLGSFGNHTAAGISINSITGDDAITDFNTATFPEEEPEKMAKDIYNLSYCYTGFLGISLNLLFGTIVSVLTGPVSPKDVEPKLVSPRCLYLYRRIWEVLKPNDGLTFSKDDYQLDKSTVMPMLIVDVPKSTGKSNDKPE
ncbi:sodium-coupled monocarboxylate transporter 1-like [Macrobrachium rosenbergii]|uniref:sodium-coupled monocarboxylate transporter 1-like n=1 Tax=Macrobrachium rosenbergii TaxID=79674 RepID=UPI0034D4CE84